MSNKHHRPNPDDERFITRLDLSRATPAFVSGIVAALDRAFAASTSFAIDVAGRVHAYKRLGPETRAQARAFAKGYAACHADLIAQAKNGGSHAAA